MLLLFRRSKAVLIFVLLFIHIFSYAKSSNSNSNPNSSNYINSCVDSNTLDRMIYEAFCSENDSAFSVNNNSDSSPPCLREPSQTTEAGIKFLGTQSALTRSEENFSSTSTEKGILSDSHFEVQLYPCNSSDIASFGFPEFKGPENFSFLDTVDSPSSQSSDTSSTPSPDDILPSESYPKGQFKEIPKFMVIIYQIASSHTFTSFFEHSSLLYSNEINANTLMQHLKYELPFTYESNEIMKNVHEYLLGEYRDTNNSPLTMSSVRSIVSGEIRTDNEGDIDLLQLKIPSGPSNKFFICLRIAIIIFCALRWKKYSSNLGPLDGDLVRSMDGYGVDQGLAKFVGTTIFGQSITFSRYSFTMQLFYFYKSSQILCLHSLLGIEHSLEYVEFYEYIATLYADQVISNSETEPIGDVHHFAKYAVLKLYRLLEGDCDHTRTGTFDLLVSYFKSSMNIMNDYRNKYKDRVDSVLRIKDLFQGPRLIKDAFGSEANCFYLRWPCQADAISDDGARLNNLFRRLYAANAQSFDSRISFNFLDENGAKLRQIFPNDQDSVLTYSKILSDHLISVSKKNTTKDLGRDLYEIWATIENLDRLLDALFAYNQNGFETCPLTPFRTFYQALQNRPMVNPAEIKLTFFFQKYLRRIIKGSHGINSVDSIFDPLSVDNGPVDWLISRLFLLHDQFSWSLLQKSDGITHFSSMMSKKWRTLQWPDEESDQWNWGLIRNVPVDYFEKNESSDSQKTLLTGEMKQKLTDSPTSVVDITDSIPSASSDLVTSISCTKFTNTDIMEKLEAPNLDALLIGKDSFDSEKFSEIEKSNLNLTAEFESETMETKRSVLNRAKSGSSIACQLLRIAIKNSYGGETDTDEREIDSLYSWAAADAMSVFVPKNLLKLKRMYRRWSNFIYGYKKNASDYYLVNMDLKSPHTIFYHTLELPMSLNKTPSFSAYVLNSYLGELWEVREKVLTGKLMFITDFQLLTNLEINCDYILILMLRDNVGYVFMSLVMAIYVWSKFKFVNSINASNSAMYMNRKIAEILIEDFAFDADLVEDWLFLNTIDSPLETRDFIRKLADQIQIWYSFVQPKSVEN